MCVCKKNVAKQSFFLYSFESAPINHTDKNQRSERGVVITGLLLSYLCKVLQRFFGLLSLTLTSPGPRGPGT